MKLLAISFFLLISSPLWADQKGRVMLNDSTPAPFASIYVPELGVGTITDFDGYYQLVNPGPGEHAAEISYLGYQTASVMLSEERELTITLDEQPVKLNEVFITPNGEDPAVYIMRQLKESCSKNHDNSSFRARASVTFHSQDLDIIQMIMPKMFLWMIRKAIAVTGLGPLFDYCLEHQELTAKGEYTAQLKQGRVTQDQWVLLSSSSPLDKKVEESLKKASCVDPFRLAYRDYLTIKPAKSGYRLVGTTEEEDKVIDVLVKELDKDTITLYVVENDWGILRREVKNTAGVTRLECREVSPHLWLPISYVDDPKLVDFNEILQEVMKEYEAEKKPGEKPSRTERKVMERIQEVMKGDRRFYPSMTTCYSFKYR